MSYLKIGTVDPNYPAVSNACNGDTVHVSSLFSLVGRTALITGGNGGIGSYMARGMAEAGADIIIFKIPGEQSTFPDELGQQIGRKIHVYECDLGDSKAIRATVAKVLEDGLTVDILCNVAGISGEFVQVLDENDDHRGKVAQIHYHAPYVLSQLIGHHMASRQKGGKIINISSIAAFRPQTRFSTYGPMKAALSYLTETLATEFARYNIQVNDLVPGWIQTPLSQRMLDNPDFKVRTVERIPAGRWGRPGDFKGVTVFLASRASDYITGNHIFVDGGWHCM